MPIPKEHLENTGNAIKYVVKHKYVDTFMKIKLNQTIREWCLAWLERSGNQSKS